MISQRIDGLEAWETLLRSDSGRWSAEADRFGSAPTAVAHTPKFSFQGDERFFCVGSCFARNIEEQLIYSGMTVLSKRIVSPADEWPARVNGFVNKFTVDSIYNEVAGLVEESRVTSDDFEEQSNGWIDPQLCYGMPPVSLDRAIERRRYLTASYFSRLRDSDVVIITLGLIEAWFDGASGRFLNAAPSFSSVRREPGRYSLHVRTVDDTLATLTKIRAGLRHLNPQVKIIVTVSPVPMRNTFTGRDVLVANTASKSVLRVAADMFAASADDIDYFPSFDMVNVAPRAQAYAADCMHVSDKVVGTIVRKFLLEYFGRAFDATPFNETAYLAANEDVHAAVRRAEWVSGYDHWMMHGRLEGRLLRPAGGPTPLMATIGAD